MIDAAPGVTCGWERLQPDAARTSPQSDHRLTVPRGVPDDEPRYYDQGAHMASPAPNPMTGPPPGASPAPNPMAGPPPGAPAAKPSSAAAWRRSTETKSAFKATEFLVYIASVAAVLIASYLVGETEGGRGDVFLADRAWLFVTLLTIGYMISRGLAKSGSRERYDA